jgi:transposase-like protein
MSNTRWPPKPPPDTRCDSYRLGNDELEIERCPNTAFETVIMKALGHQSYLCPSCADTLVTKGSILRNPKRRT